MTPTAQAWREAADREKATLGQPPAAAGEPAAVVRSRTADGGTFVLDVPDVTPAVWGEGSRVLWAEGEALMIAAGNGLGKTSIAAQVVRSRLGLTSGLLDLPIRRGQRRVLYLAMDRPMQIARAMHRIFRPDERDTLDALLTVWKGPPPADLAKSPEVLAQLCAEHDADTVVVDSLKDAAVGLSEDVVAAGWNRALQGAITAGVEVLVLHHTVKRGPNGAEPASIADVYGSAWLTAGTGSVVLLTGSPGDPIVGLRHVKQPAEEVGPWRVIHDNGCTTIHHGTDLLKIVQATGQLTAKTAASALYTTEKPSPAQVEKARRKLDQLAARGDLAREGDPCGQSPARYVKPTLTSVGMGA